MVTIFVLGAWALPAVQVKTPLDASRLAPVVAPAHRLKVRIWGGRSGSFTTLFTVSNCPAATVLLPMGDSTGGEFTSFTTTLNRWVALKLGLPSSNTRTR